ncbi:hypothetical protein ACFLSE_09310 [Bacteroidota bacterium]
MRNVLFLGILLLGLASQSCDPGYSLSLINKTDTLVTYRVIEPDTLYLLDYKYIDISDKTRHEKDSAFIKHYFQNNELYTEIILKPNEFVLLSSAIGHRPNFAETQELIVGIDTFRIKGEIILRDMIEYDDRDFFYEFRNDK